MVRTIVCVTAVALASLNAVSAQDFTAAQRAACKVDYEQYCKGTMPGGGRVLACLSKQTGKLSAACKEVVAEAKK